MLGSKIGILILSICITVVSCNQKKKQENILVTNETTEITIDLLKLQAENKLGKYSLITVNEDPVYHKKKIFKAINAVLLVQNQVDLNKIAINNTKIVFECIDGYKPEMPLELFLNAEPFIAFEDINAPKGSKWEQIYKDGIPMDAAPFYLIYPKISAKDNQYKWPYNLVKIHFEPLHELDNELFPKNNKEVISGYQLYTKHCISCHAINSIGGQMGPELNYPKNVTEYWIENQLVDYIVNPASFRNKVKMPTLGISKTEAQDIVEYLKIMAQHKKQSTAE